MSLPESTQDANLAGTYEARPGASNAAPAGPSSTNDDLLSSSVKSSLDNIAEPKPVTQSISETLPTAEGAAEAVKTGASSLIAGISSLAFGAKDAVAQNAAASHPESENATKVDDLHVPGAFEDETADSEDVAAVKQGIQSAVGALPSGQDVKNSVPSAQDVKNSLPSTGAISQQVPSLPLGSHTNQRDQSQYSNSLGGISQREQYGSENINSVGFNSTTSGLAGQVPLESRGVPQIVSDSQRQAGFPPEAASNAEAVQDKEQLERELQQEVPKSTTTSEGFPGISAGHIPQIVADSQVQAGVSPEAAANAEAVQDKTLLERELKQEVPETRAIPEGFAGTSAGQMPQIVADSQRQAGVSPEAAANLEAVQDKTLLERELKEEVPESAAISTGSSGVSAGLDRGVPQIVADSQKKADASPEASANAEAVQDKQQVERELKREVPQQSSTDNTPVNLGEAVSGGLVAAGAAIAGAATYARQKTHEATGTDPVAVLPESAQQAIDGQVISPSTTRDSQPLSASQQPTNGQNITDTLSSGLTSAGIAAANAATYARQKTHEVTGTDPVAVLPESAQQAIDGQVISPATARGSSTAPGSQQVQTGGQSITSNLTSGASSAGSAAADAAMYARQKTHGATGTDPVAVLPTSVQKNIDGDSSANSTAGISYSPDSSFPRVTNDSTASGRSHGLDLHAGVHNGVVGDHLDDASPASHRPVSGSHSGHWQPGSSATVAHIPSLQGVDLSAGVKNTVVGSGAVDANV